MMTPQLPERPNVEQLKRQAKDLLRSAKEGEAEALKRMRSLPAFARQGDDSSLAASLALHDAQSVIARELGFLSWPALVEHVEELTLAFGAAVEQFINAATEVQPDRAERLLRLHPRIATANFHMALLFGDLGRVESELARDDALATRPGGPRHWQPILYLCHTSLKFGPAPRGEGLTAVAHRLLSLGADPNARFPWLHHGVQRAALWGAVCITQLLPLAEALLEAGADPNDGVTVPLAASGGDIAALELLYRYGADVNQAWASDGSSTLYAIMNWAETPKGIRWLLDHGADADAVFAPNGETPLHVAARRWDPQMIELLVTHGADVARPRADGRTPFAVAQLSGNSAAAEWLTRHGAPTALSEVDRFVALCGRGDRSAAQAMLREHPHLREQLGSEHYAGLYRAAEIGDTRVIETMLACGFEPNHSDEEIGKTALHEAAHWGRANAVRVLLAHGASVSVRDREFHGHPLIWAADGLRTRGEGDGREFNEVARLLLAAGSPVEWESGAEPSEEIVEIIDSWRR